METGKPGIMFRETMAGWFALGESDPAQGQRKGEQERSWLTIRPLVTIESLDAFQFDDRHTGKLRSSLHFPPLFGSAEPSGEGQFNLFARVGNTPLKLMIYEFSFEHEDQRYFFSGKKNVENNPGPDMWTDTTTLLSKLYKGADHRAPIIGSGILRITLPGFMRQLISMRPTNCSNSREKLEAYLTFGNFFFGELWDSYVRRS